jgi:hypothetical protein
MKIKLLIILTAISLKAHSTNWYISSGSGNDANAGTSTAAAWASITKLNASWGSINAGDSVLFMKNEFFRGTIRVTKSGTSGNPIVIGAYGTGDNPIFTAFESLEVWTSIGGNKYTCPSSAKANVNMLVFDDAVAQIAQYPNGNVWIPSTANGTVTGNNTINTVTVGTTPTAVAGDEIIIKKKDWNNERDTITSIAGNTISYRQYSAYPGIVGYGVKYQRNAAFLDIQGEWDFNAGVVTLYSTDNPGLHDIKISNNDTAIFLGTQSYITVENIAFEGYNMYGIHSFNASSGGNHITAQYCDFTYMGRSGITFWQTSNVVIDHCNATDCLGNAFFIRNEGSGGLANATITNCIVQRTGQWTGQEISGDRDGGAAITANGGTNSIIMYNNVNTSGSHACEWHCSSGLRLMYNVFDTYANRKQDIGGIYCFNALTQSGYNGRNYATWSNNIIRSNLVLNGVGSNAGTTSGLKARGIYNDEGVNGVLVDSNTCAFIASAAYYNNSNKNIVIRDNTSYMCGGSFSFSRFKDAPNDTLNRVVSNIFFPYVSVANLYGWYNNALDSVYPRTAGTTNPTVALSAVLADVQQSIYVDSNKYFLPASVTTPFVLYGRRYLSSSGSLFNNTTFSYWTGTVGFDTHSQVVFSSTDELRFETNDLYVDVDLSLGANYLDVNGDTVSVAHIPAHGSWLGKFVSVIPPDPTPTGEKFLPPWIIHE